MNNHIRWIINIWSKRKGFLLLLIFLTILSTSVTVAYPYVFRILIDNMKAILDKTVSASYANDEIRKIIWMILSIGLVKLIAGLYPGVRAYINYKFEYAIRKEYFSYIMKKDYSFFNKFRTGDLVTRLTDDLIDFPKICWFLCSGIFRAFDSAMKILFCISVMFFMNWKLTLLSIAPLPFMLIVFYVTSDRLYKRFMANQQAISRINNQLEMSFSGIRIIKSFVCENKYVRFFDEALANKLGTEMNVVKLNSMINLIYEYIDKTAQISVILFGGYMVLKGSLSIGTFFAFYNYLSLLIYPMLDLPQLLISGKQAFVCIDRLEEIKEYPVNKPEKQEETVIEKVESITFENVAFDYDRNRVNILSEVGFTVKRGEKIVIIGPVGAGKSTILGLLLGILQPKTGRLLINGIDYSRINLYELRNIVGYVPQEPILFSGTIRDNIIFGRKGYSEEDYRRVLSISQIEEEIEQFSLKDMTVIGQRGVSLSGGQKQRIAIARALLMNPQILVLDDITASLDAGNEEKLWKDINSIFKDITCFIVSHRLSTLRYVDNVMFMEQGKIVDKGIHEEMVKRSPVYKEFIMEHFRKSDV